MKILFFINGIHPGGKERRLIELMKEMKKCKEFEFELVVMNEEISYPEIFDLQIKIHFLIRQSKKDIRIFQKFFSICKRFKPNIVHCWDGMTAVYAIPACKLLNIKIVNGMVVDTPVGKNILNKNWLRAQITFPFSNLIIGNSEAGLKAYKASKKKSICIYNGMDLNRFKNLKDPNQIRQEIFGTSHSNYFIVGMVAAFENRKDYSTLIKAALQLIPEHTQLRFLLIGGGSNLEKLKSEVPPEFQGKIIFMGKRSNVEAIINIFDIGVLLTNSKLHGEGISNSIIEYMALGKPVIATRGGGTNEVVKDGKNGYLIDFANENQLKEKIVTLMNNNDYRLDFGQNGFHLVHEMLDLDIMAKSYFLEYHKLLNKY
jgi:glycosyltransferase involved in cell wall biosynthesis